MPYAKFTKAADGTPMDDDLLFERPNDCVVPNVVWSWMAFFGANHFPEAKPATIADFRGQEWTTWPVPNEA